jgi:hypothetical protein
MPAKLAITNFSRGEFGPQLYGRVDLPQYNAGAKELTNFIVQRYGGVRFRDGFRHVAPVFGDITKPVKLIPFQYSIDQAYVVVMRDSIMNVAARGGMVLEEDLKIQSVTYGATTTLAIPFHGYAVGDILFLNGNTGPEEMNNRFVTVTAVPTAGTVTVALNSTGFDALTDSTGIVRGAPPTPPPTPEPPPPAPPPAPPPPPVGTGESNESPEDSVSSGPPSSYYDPGSSGWDAYYYERPD